MFTSAADRERFVTEAEAWVSLGLHPNVWRLLPRPHGGRPSRVFAQYVTGGSLQERLHDRRLYRGGRVGRLTRIMDVAVQTARGLAQAHGRGLVHQDVKPDDVLFDDHGQDLTAKVADFGPARAQAATGARPEGERPSDRTLLVPTAGLTPVFASPEQPVRKALGRCSDTCSFAVSVLQMFTGGVDRTTGSAAGEVLTAYRADGPRRRGLRTPWPACSGGAWSRTRPVPPDGGRRRRLAGARRPGPDHRL
ncbi:protein kinase [Streptomyces parvus]|uniref:protein kinase domain-containing protein n=1 Tax=Streptomyces parvus TaxID=66428 RepID=UPI00343796CC